MKVTVIGTSSAYPTNNNPTSSYLVTTEEGGSILLDCGSGSMLVLEKLLDLEKLNHVFISHKHPDHIADLGVLQHRRLVKKAMNKDLDDLQIFGSFEPNINDEIKSIENSQVFDLSSINQIGPFTVSFHQTLHPVETYAIRLEVDNKSIVYTADTAYCEKLIKFSKDADLLITESSLYPGFDGTQSGHMNVDEAIQFGKKTNARNIVLSHLPSYGPIEKMHESVQNSGQENIIFAEPRMKIIV